MKISRFVPVEPNFGDAPGKIGEEIDEGGLCEIALWDAGNKDGTGLS